MQDRAETYNLLVRLGLEVVFTPEFLARIDREEALHQKREVYDASKADLLINRILAY